jgi:tyrosyl-tRNA synthetase
MSDFVMADIIKTLPLVDLAKSRAEARRLLIQGAIEIDGKKLTSNPVPIYDGSIVKVGKRRFIRIVNGNKRADERRK